MNFEFSPRIENPPDTLATDSILCKKRIASVEVRKLRPPFLKDVDHSGFYRPLVLEMKEWPDALTMFSQGQNVLHTKFKNEKKITFCELCETNFNHLQKHLSSSEHIKNATYTYYRCPQMQTANY